MPTISKKPSLRGISHIVGALVAAAAGIYLILESPTPSARLACSIYSVSLVAMFAISASYHVPHWSPSARAFMRRMDHCGIYLIISGTYTPFCILSLDQDTGRRLLIQVWTGAGIGVVHSLFSRGGNPSSKLISAAIYIALGWIAIPYMGQMRSALGTFPTQLIVAGGVIYSLGAVVYACHWPDPVPLHFGYHEIFHLAVIVAAMMHFIAVKTVVNTLH